MQRALTFRQTLLVGAAAISLSVAAAPQTARAENPFDPFAEPTGIWLELEAGYQFLSGAKQPWAVRSEWGTATNLGFSETRPNHAGNFIASVGYRFDGNWDIAGAYTGLRSRTKRDAIATPGGPIDFYAILGPYRYWGYSARVEIKQRIDVVDFEAGYNFQLGNRLQVRATAGLRYVNWRQDTNTQFFGGADFNPPNDDRATAHFEANYWGIGPRIGASGKFMLARIGPGALLLSGGINASVLFGEAQNKTDQISFGTPFTSESNKNKTVFNLGAKLGLGYAFPIANWVGTVTAGYRFDGWWGLVSTNSSPANIYATGGIPDDARGQTGKNRGNLYSHGPFVNFKLAF